MSGTFDGYLLIADITGYTLYLNKSELEHAQEILTSLLTVLVDHTRPPLVISRLAGDAVISYGLGNRFVGGQTFVEMIEATYLSFRKAIEHMLLNNACRCNACTNISNLDLKFFVHFGAFAIQHIGGHDELVGNDVNLIHRLLKNHVVESTGYSAYCLFTESAITQLGLADNVEAMAAHVETYEHLGEVNVWVQNMHPVWEQKRRGTSFPFPPEQVLLRYEIDVELPPERVWDYFMQPEFLKILLAADRSEVANRERGRIAPGSVYHCYHGDQLIPLTILEWQPFERIVTQVLMPVPFPNTFALVEYRLSKNDAGTTRLTQAFCKASGPLLGRLVSNLGMKLTAKQGERDIAAFKERIEADDAARGNH